MTNSTTLSNTFDDHFFTIGPKMALEIPLNNGPSFRNLNISGLLSERFQIHPH